MSKKITQAAEVDLSIKGSQSVKSIKQELKEAKEQAIAMARAFGEFSPQATAAQQRLANLKDEMEDLNHRVNALNPDKFSRIGTAAQGLAHGFTAAQGAATLFGSESENVNKILARTQAAMALSQGLQGLGDSKKALLSLGSAIKGPVIQAFTTLRGAIIATGIGALAVGLGLVVNNFDDVKKAVKRVIDAIPGLSSVINALGEAWEWVTEKALAFTDAIGLTDTALDKQISQLEKSTKAAERAAEIDEALGKDTYAQRKKILEDQLRILELNQEDEEDILEKKHEIRLLDAKREKSLADQRAKEEEKRREEEKAAQEKAAQEWLQRAQAGKTAQISIQKDLELIRLDDRARQIRELEIWRDEQARILRAGGQKLTALNELYIEKERKLRDEWAAEDQKKREDLEKAKTEAIRAAAQERLRIASEEYSQQQANTNQFYAEQKLALLKDLEGGKISREEYSQKLSELELEKYSRQIQDAKDYNQTATELEIQLAESRKALAEETAAKQIEIAKKEQEARRALIGSILEGAEALGQILTKEGQKREKMSKMFALAQIAIDTATAISSLVASSEANPANAVTFGAAGVAQFAAGIARILVNISKAKQLLSSAGGSGGGPAPGGGVQPGGAGARPPQFQTIGQDIRISGLGSGGSQGGTGSGGIQKIPVVEYADIRKAQRRVSITEETGEL